jgi:prophage tail gpP-like protein
MTLPKTTSPDLDVFEMRLPDFGISVSNWISYSYNENFLTPTDGWQFEMDGESAPPALLDALETCPKVQFSINGHLQSSGRVSHHESDASTDGGWLIRIEGRDILGPMVDGHVDPSLNFTESMTLNDVLDTVFADFGLNSFTIENDTNLNVITGQKRGKKTSKRGRALKSFTIHQLKPYPKEGAFAFVSRISQRFGLWLWPSADGQTIVVGKPDFDQAPIYKMRRKRALGESQFNNIVRGPAIRDYASQASCILASGYGGGGEFDKATLRVGVINPGIETNFAPIFKKYPKLKFIQPTVHGIVTFQDDHARPLYLHDDESKTPEQLENFALREMALLTRRGLTCRYSFVGHSIGGVPFAVNTIGDVDDDPGNVHSNMWVLSRTLSKAAGKSGTTSNLELIRPGTLFF